MPIRARMPTKVKVGAMIYKIERRKRGSPELTDKLEDGRVIELEGICHFTECTIYVQSRLPLSKAQEVLHHEINHACTYPSLCNKQLQDEEFVDGISPMSLQVIRDNPELINYYRS